MINITRVCNNMVLEFVFPKEETISTIVCGSSIIKVMKCLYGSFKYPCNPYAEVIRGIVVLETQELKSHYNWKCDSPESCFPFLQVNYVKYRVKFGIGPNFVGMKCYSFSGVLAEIARP